jgi:hypothetical protein
LRQELHTIVLFKEDLDKRIDALQSRLAKIGKAPYQGLDDSVLVPSFPPFWNTVYAR